MIDYSTNAQELLLMIGDREFQHYKAIQRVTELERENQFLKQRLRELEDGRLEQANNNVELQHRGPSTATLEGLRRGFDVPERASKPSGRNDEVQSTTGQNAGKGERIMG